MAKTGPCLGLLAALLTSTVGPVTAQQIAAQAFPAEVRGQVEEMMGRSVLAPPVSPTATCGTLVVGQEKNWSAPAPWKRVFSHHPSEWSWLRQYPAGTNLRFCQYTARVTGHPAGDQLHRRGGDPQSDAGAARDLDGERLPDGDPGNRCAAGQVRRVRARALLGPAAAGGGRQEEILGHPAVLRWPVRGRGRGDARPVTRRRGLPSRRRGALARAARPAGDRLFRADRDGRRPDRQAGDRRRARRMLQDRRAQGMAGRLGGAARRHDPRPVLECPAQARPHAGASSASRRVPISSRPRSGAVWCARRIWRR